MSRTAGRLGRILAMLAWVMAHEGATVEEVCSRFGYTPKTLIDDLDLVFVCGLPGYGPGELMVAYVDGDEVIIEMADYFSSAPSLTSDQALRLLTAGLTAASISEPTPALASALLKLQTALFPDGQETLAMNMAEPPTFRDLLSDAVASSSVVRIKYLSVGKGEVSNRAVEPLSVFSESGQWYLNAFCRLASDRRSFRIDRIESAEVMEERFESPTELPPNRVGYVPSEDDITVQIILSPPAFWVAEYYPVDVITRTSEHLTINFSSSGASLIVNLLLRLGANAVLVGSPSIGTRLEKKRSEILQRYR
jgi:proteasome accessory factor C